jgi:hypothetical protein
MMGPYCEVTDRAHHEFLHAEVERLRGELSQERDAMVGLLENDKWALDKAEEYIGDLEAEVERLQVIEKAAREDQCWYCRNDWPLEERSTRDGIPKLMHMDPEGKLNDYNEPPRECQTPHIRNALAKETTEMLQRLERVKRTIAARLAEEKGGD